MSGKSAKTWLIVLGTLLCILATYGFWTLQRSNRLRYLVQHIDTISDDEGLELTELPGATNLLLNQSWNRSARIELRETSIDFLSGCPRDARIVPALREFLREDDARIRRAALWSFWLLDLYEPDDTTYNPHPGSQLERGVVFTYWSDRYNEVRFAAVKGSYQYTTGGSIEDWNLKLESPNAQTRLDAVLRLGCFESPKASTQLVKCLDDSDGVVAGAAIWSLIRCKKRDLAISKGLAMCKSPSAPHRLYALAVLGEEAPKKIKPMLPTLVHDPDLKVSRLAISLAKVIKKQRL